jgi:hypothetical protein
MGGNSRPGSKGYLAHIPFQLPCLLTAGRGRMGTSMIWPRKKKLEVWFWRAHHKLCPYHRELFNLTHNELFVRAIVRPECALKDPSRCSMERFSIKPTSPALSGQLPTVILTPIID